MFNVLSWPWLQNNELIPKHKNGMLRAFICEDSELE